MYICIYDILAIFYQSWKKKERRKKIEKYFKSSRLRDLKTEGQEFEILRSLEQFIQTIKVQNNFWLQNAFLTNTYNSNWKKIGFRNMQEKFEKIYCEIVAG